MPIAEATSPVSALPQRRGRKTKTAAPDTGPALHTTFVAEFESARDAYAREGRGVRIDQLSEAEQRKLLFGE